MSGNDAPVIKPALLANGLIAAWAAHEVKMVAETPMSAPGPHPSGWRVESTAPERELLKQLQRRA